VKIHQKKDVNIILLNYLVASKGMVGLRLAVTKALQVVGERIALKGK